MAIRIVFCYAREDEKLVEQLKAHLRPLEREQLIEMWYDRNISAGMEWQRAINQRLDSADLILLLISADFMNSDYCYSIEMQRALELRRQGKVYVIPIILRPVFWQVEALFELQALPVDGIPVTDTQRWKNADEALYNVTQGICLALQQLAARPQSSASGPLNPDFLQKVLERYGLLIKKERPTREKYRAALHRDPRIAKVQIMSMSRPLKITDIYVRLRIHEDVSREFALDPLLQKAGRMRDPNILLEKKRELLKTRSSQALEPDEAIRKYMHCVIVGDPGSGKTTLLKYLALKSVDGALAGLPALPIHVELNAFVSSKIANLLEFAAATWDERYGFAKDEALIFMQNELIAGRAMLLLDALDETVIGESSQAAEASYKRVADIITSLATRYHTAPIVVTARKAGYQLREPLVGFNELEVLDFTLDDMKRFITNWFTGTFSGGSSPKATDLIARLERALRIQELATNPLLLSLIVLVYESQLDLPDRRAELYKRCIDMLLTEWDSKRHLARRREFQPLHKRLLLEEIAWHFHQQGSRYFSERELLAVIAVFLPAIGLQAEDSKRILQEIANENGILKEQAQGWYGFIHMTLQEYCAAQYLTDHNELATLMQFVDDPRWEEVILLYAGQVPDASPLLEGLLGKVSGAPTDDIFRNNLILAGRCLAARPTIRRVELREEILASLLTLLKTTNYSLTEEQVIETLLGLGDPKVNKRLLYLLNDEQLMRSDFIQILVDLGGSTIEPDLLAMVQDERHTLDLRLELFEAVLNLRWKPLEGMYSDSEALEYLLPDLLAMVKDEHYALDLRCQLIEGFLSEDPEIFEHILPDLLAIVKDEHYALDLRCQLIEGLSSKAFERILPDLLSLLRDNQCNPSVRIAIMKACQNMSDTSKKTHMIATLRDMLRNEPRHTNVYKNIVLTLGYLGEAVPVSELLLFLANKQKKGIVEEICSLLVRLKDKTAIPGLLQILKNERKNLETRKAIVNVIYSLDNSSAIAEFFNLLRDERSNYSLRWEIGSILIRIRALTMSALLSLNIDKQLSIYIGTVALWNLGNAKESKIIGAEIVSEFLNLLKDKQLDPHLRDYIALNLRTMSYYWPTGMKQELLNILKNEPNGTRIHDNLVLTIAMDGETAVLQDVLSLLKQRRYPNDFNAFYNIVNMLKDQKLVKDLLYLLTDRQQSYDLRKAVANVLESLIDDEETAAQLANYAPRLYIDKAIYDSLWRLSRRTGVKILA